jgi:hypothetical protein
MAYVTKLRKSGTQEPRAQGKGTGLASRPGKQKERFFAGTPEEVANRENVGYGAKAPQFSPSAFKPIQGQLSTGKSLADPSFDQRNGTLKFSAGPDA